MVPSRAIGGSDRVAGQAKWKSRIIRVQGAAAMGTSKKFGCYSITIDGDDQDDQYELAVEHALHRIESSYTGKVLLSAIRSTNKAIQIIPYSDCICNAGTLPADRAAASLRNQVVAIPYNDQNACFIEYIKGTGTGCDEKVYFTPTVWGFGVRGACAKYAGAPGASPSLVLFHELAHAYRNARGVSNSRPTTGTNILYDSTEEFFAIVLSNVLATDPTFDTANRTLRADHDGGRPLAANLSTSKGFVADTENRKMMKELAYSESCLVSALRGSKSTFNPFAEPLDNDG
jgi:hypothetical protein